MKLDMDFYGRHADETAPKLLGKLLCRRTEQGIIRLRITETECYMGSDDTACHASKGKTQRTEVLYRQGGTAYVYLCYGMHILFNVVCGNEGYPEAVLIRGADEFDGPGKLTKALDITKQLNKENLCNSNELWIEDDGYEPSYTALKRVGIDYADKKDIDKLWRFIIKKVE